MSCFSPNCRVTQLGGKLESAILGWITTIGVLAAILNPVAGAPQVQQPEPLASTVAGTVNPVPFINQPLVPDAIKPGEAGFTLTVNGTGFVSGATVNWNGSARGTTSDGEGGFLASSSPG